MYTEQPSGKKTGKGEQKGRKDEEKRIGRRERDARKGQKEGEKEGREGVDGKGKSGRNRWGKRRNINVSARNVTGYRISVT